MKKAKQNQMKLRLSDLDLVIERLKIDMVLHTIKTEWKSSIHLRLTIDGLRTDFWPSTGRWYDLSSGNKGSGVKELECFIQERNNPKWPTLINIDPPPKRLIKPTVTSNPDAPPWSP